MKNLYIGSNELVVVFRSGTHYVLEAWEDYEPVFQGTYAECLEYMEARRIDYLESLY